MNKKIKVVLSAALISLTMGTTALADNNAVADLKQALISAGVPSNYVGNVVDYLQKVNITQAQADQVMAKINEAKALIGDVKDVTKLDASVKSQIQSLVSQAGDILGLNVNFGKDSSGKITIVVTTPSGGTLVQLSSETAGSIVTNFDINVIVNALEEIVEFSNNTNKNDGETDNPNFIPEGGGSLNQTATGYGNLMLAGTTMMSMAGGVHVLSKKRK